MISANIVYIVTSFCFALLWLFLWFESSFSISRMIFLLFAFDIALTIEAGVVANIMLIAMLHMITIPAFFALIYLDLMDQHRSEFTCFVCGVALAKSEPTETVNRILKGRRRSVLVHEHCVKLESTERKAFRSRLFRKGIPE